MLLINIETLKFTPKQRNLQLEDAFEDTACKPGFEIVKL